MLSHSMSAKGNLVSPRILIFSPKMINVFPIRVRSSGCIERVVLKYLTTTHDEFSLTKKLASTFFS